MEISGLIVLRAENKKNQIKHINMKRVILPIFISLVITACTTQPELSDVKAPNIILVMTDDQGYGDLGIHGNPFIRTPVLDSLATHSTRIDPFYVSPVCAPTRSSLMTGRYHLRTGVYDTYNGGAMMSTEEFTVAEVLAENGYHTAMVGKWHLGDAYPMRPMDQGFQYSLAHKGGGIGQPGDDFKNFMRGDSSYFDPYLWENGKQVRRQGYCSDIYTDQAIQFITNHSSEQTGDPFFLYLSFNAPHTPLQLPEQYEMEYAEMSYGSADFAVSGENVAQMNPRDMESARRVYGMVSNIDDNLGRLLNTLNTLGIEENTLVVFLSDNGPQQRRYTAGLNQRKSSVMEGGIRVPCMFYWKGQLEENRIISTPSAHIDMMPTLLEFAGISYHGEMDGISLVPELTGEQVIRADRPLFFVWERGYPQRYSNMAVRKGQYKLVGQIAHGEADDQLKLFDLENDPYELVDVSAEQTDVKAALQLELDQWYEEIIVSPHLLESPRIVIGSEYENPVILGRNDWKGPKAMQWSSDEAFGYYDIRVADPGPYKVKMVFKDHLPAAGQLRVRVGTRQYWTRNSDTSISEISIENLIFEPGDHAFEGWYQAKGGIYSPICIEIEKMTK
jgi:arylsulfatase A-like enzyme